MKRREFQSILDNCTLSLVLGDFELWRSLVRRPLVLATVTQQTVLHDEDSLFDTFERYTKIIREQRVSDIVRHPLSVERSGTTDAFFGKYRTEMFGLAGNIVESFDVTALLRRIDGRWCFGTIVYAPLYGNSTDLFLNTVGSTCPDAAIGRASSRKHHAIWIAHHALATPFTPGLRQRAQV